MLVVLAACFCCHQAVWKHSDAYTVCHEEIIPFHFQNINL